VAELALHQHPAQRVQAAAADLLGHVGRVEARPERRVPQPTQQPGIEAAAALHLVLVRHQLAVYEGAGRLHHGPLLD
jgi:hypothetical protein